MTREAFIEVLNAKHYSYEIVVDKVIVTQEDDIYLASLKTLPPGVEFNNGGDINLDSLKTLPSGVEFNNRGYVNLPSLETIPPGVKFNNRGNVYWNSLIGGSFRGWQVNIDGIKPHTLLNVMIKIGIFE